MIGSLRGRIISLSGDVILIDVGGVGYQLSVPTSVSERFAQYVGEVVIPTHMHVRENEVSLYGFDSDRQREMFKALIEVSGVGPKVALAALSSFSCDAIASALSREDIALICTIPGVGKKTAQRMILDLKDKVAASVVASIDSAQPPSPTLSDAHSALRAMGFTAPEIATALKDADTSGDTPTIIAYALRMMGRTRV